MVYFCESYIKKTKTFLFFILGLILIILCGCGKQPVSTRQERLIQKAENSYHDLSEKYREEINIFVAQNKPKKIKSKLGKCVGDKSFRRTFFDKVRWLFGEDDFSAQKVPFHRYINILEDDTTKLKRLYRLLSKKRNVVSNNEILLPIQALRDNLLKIRGYIKTHREFREEERYIRLVSRTRENKK